MDHKAFLKSLSAEDKSDLTERSDRAGLLSLALHFGLILALGAAIASAVPGWQLLLLPQGLLLAFLFTLEHECTHKTPFRTDRLNEWVGRITGFLQLLPFERFRLFHLAHHKFTNDPENDPELDSPKPATIWAWGWVTSGLPNWIWLIKRMFVSASGRDNARYIPDRARQRIQREARIHIGLYALAFLAIVTVASWLFWAWILPSIVGQPALRAYLLAEHAGCAHTGDMFLNTRTTFTNKVARLLAWNMPYHAEHHTFPAVPFHKLPALHDRMRTHLGVTADGYSAFTRDYLRKLRPEP